MKLDYDFGLSRIYELVINSDPCYAFLLDGNSLLQNMTVCAHVLGHCDFFKNNAMFTRTSRDMVERMASSAERIRQYELEYGRDRVERVLDAAMAVQEHVDASRYGRRRRQVFEQARSTRNDRNSRNRDKVTMRTPYDDLWSIGENTSGGRETGDKGDEESSKRERGLPQRDLMLYLIEHSPVLDEWERDILSVLREEMLYFWPQLETKIMNEGWATYWHLRIMRDLDLAPGDALEFAKMHAGVVLPSKTSINPYHIGLAIWEDIEKRWDEPTEEERERFGREPGQGRAKMFEVREMENDVSFLRNYLTKDLIEKLDLYLYQKIGNEWRIVETDWEKVRDSICASRTNGGIPVIDVTDGDFNQSGEIYLTHAYEGVELDLKHLEKTMQYVQQLWGRTCHVETVVEGRGVLFTCDGKKTTRKFL